MKIKLLIFLFIIPVLSFCQGIKRDTVLSIIESGNFPTLISLAEHYSFSINIPVDSILKATEANMQVCEKALYLEFVAANDFPIEQYWNVEYIFSEACKCTNQYLIKKVVDKIKLNHTIGILRDSPISSLAAKGDLSLVKYLIGKGFDPTIKNYGNQSALYAASENGNYELVKFLVEDIGLRVDTVDVMGRTPIYNAVLSNNFKTFQYLLKKGNLKIDPIKDLTLYNYAMNDEENSDILRYLIHHFGFVANAKNHKGNTLLLLSMYPSPDPWGIRYILENGANPNDVNLEGKNALFYCTYGYLEVFNLLLAKGTNPHQLDSTGRTSFEYILDELLFLLNFTKPVEEYFEIGILDEEKELLQMLFALCKKEVKVDGKPCLIHLAEVLVEKDALVIVNYLVNDNLLDCKTKSRFKKAIKEVAKQNGKVKFLNLLKQR